MISWPKPAPALPDPPGVTVPAWLVSAAKFASWVAMACLVAFLWLYVLEIARDRAGELHITHAGTWVGSISFWFPYVIPFALVAFGIPYVAKIALPTFMALDWRTNLWAKLWSLLIAVAVSLVVIAGTFTVQGHTLMERDRDAAVAVEGVQQSRAAIQAQIDGITEDLRASTEGNSTQAQAARVGMLAGSVEAARQQWTSSYVRPAEIAGDVNTERIRRATGSAEAAASAVARREALRQQLAASATVASVQREVVTERTGWVAGLLGWLEGARAILLSLVMDIVALIMPWIALRLEQARAVQLAMYGPAERKEPDASTMIPDLRAEAPIAEEPMDAGYKGDSIYDENGQELRWTAGFVRKKDGKWIPGHYRPTGKRKKQEIEVEYEGRVFKTSGAEEVFSAPPPAPEVEAEAEAPMEQEAPEASPELSDDDLVLIAALEEPAPAAPEAEEAGHVALPEGEGVMVKEREEAA